MIKFAATRVLAVIPVLFVISVVIVAMLRVTPGDPAIALAGPTASPEQIEGIRHDLHLDRPIYEQYALFMWGAFHGDLGKSFNTNQTVTSVIWTRLPYTVELAAAAMLFAVVFGLVAGVVAAARHNSWFDNVTMTVIVAGYSFPTFWFGLLIILVVGVKFGLLPFVGADTPAHLILPAITLGVHPATVIARLTRSSMLEVINIDYIRTAWSKGLPERTVLLRHGLRNACLPVVTVIGLEIGGLLGGAVITESIFAWPGLGTLVINAINTRDYPIVQGVVLFAALTFVVTNLIVDLIYGVLDPRIRYE